MYNVMGVRTLSISEAQLAQLALLLRKEFLLNKERSHSVNKKDDSLSLLQTLDDKVYGNKLQCTTTCQMTTCSRVAQKKESKTRGSTTYIIMYVV